MNKKGQLFDYPILTFAIIVIGLIVASPFLLKFINTFKENLPAAIGNSSVAGSEQAIATSTSILTTTSNIWDGITIFLVIGALLILIVSAFLIDTHPVWMVLYIIINLILVLFLPDIVTSMGQIYSSDVFNAPLGTEANQLTFMSYVVSNFGAILVGVMVLSGIIIYGKIAFFSQSGAGGRP